MTVFFRILNISLIICLFIAAASPQALAQENHVFTVRDIDVDVTAESAAEARDKAFILAQEEAFVRLAGKLLPNASGENIAVPEPQVLQNLIRNFEINREQLSSVRYKASFTFRFKEDAIRNYLERTGLQYTDVASKPILVLPYYQTENQILLWDRFNPWLSAWRETDQQGGLVPVITPIGDLEDIQSLNDQQPLNYEKPALDLLVNRYGAGEAILAIAAMPGENSLPPTSTAEYPLVIFIYRTDRPEPEFVTRLAVEPAPAETLDSLLQKGVKAVYEVLQQYWKNQTVVRPDEKNHLLVNVYYRSLEQWLTTKQAIESVQGVTGIEYRSINPDFALVKLSFQGSERRLRLALAQENIILSQPRMNMTGFDNAGNQGNISGNINNVPLVYELYLERFRSFNR